MGVPQSIVQQQLVTDNEPPPREENEGQREGLGLSEPPGPAQSSHCQGWLCSLPARQLAGGRKITRDVSWADSVYTTQNL